ncbi:hypothetical protein HFO60_01260 [Rhizobium leguminosarum]|uniref:ribbon-helix-helix domain-containing protein n=1 Tax=Rhizobium leguminosarum TaxID=384 RepID=UPI001C9659B3|nr:ribbon-helix-helix domain-containing protein [Rhizobium leguminosarum]MBY5538709.1 hypothetical protein [Rhizobium leguminosarum]
MNSARRLIGVHADEVLAKKIDGHVGIGKPGDKDYFASRSDFVRRALFQLLENLQDRQDTVSGVDPA